MITLVSTIYNEASRLSNTIRDLKKQTLQPDEIVIVDAGSIDGTYELLENWQKESLVPIVLYQEKGCNVARGRNLAIQFATHELIVSTDFGCRFDCNWLQSLIEPFLQNIELQVAGGAFTVDESDVLSLPAKADYLLQRGYPIVLDDCFSVSSRSIAYKKEVWKSIGGYPEWLTLAADDTIFWRKIREMKFTYVLVDKPYVFWVRHKTNKGFLKEAFRYGLGDGESRINFRNIIISFIETLLRYCFFLSFIFIFFSFSYPLLLLLFIFVLGLRSYVNAFKAFKHIFVAVQP